MNEPLSPNDGPTFTVADDLDAVLDELTRGLPTLDETLDEITRDLPSLDEFTADLEATFIESHIGTER